MENLTVSIFFKYSLLLYPLSLFSCNTGTGTENEQHATSINNVKSDTTVLQVYNLQNHNRFKKTGGKITDCETDAGKCNLDNDFITKVLPQIATELVNKDYDIQVFNAKTLVSNNHSQSNDSLKLVIYAVNFTTSTGLTGGVFEKTKLETTEAPVNCYYITTQNGVILMSYLGVPELLNINNEQLLKGITQQLSKILP